MSAFDPATILAYGAALFQHGWLVVFSGGSLLVSALASRWRRIGFVTASFVLLVIASYLAWRDEFSQVGPSITISFEGKEKTGDGYYNLDFSVQAKGLHDAVVYIDRFCRLTNGKCDAERDYSHKLQIGWRLGDGSFVKQDIAEDIEFVPFMVSDDGKKLYVFSKYKDSSFKWGDDIAPGYYQLTVSVDGASRGASDTFLVSWSGDVTTLEIREQR